jgi:hypothetical protein
METFVVRRRGIAAGAAQLDTVMSSLRTFEEQPHALHARWIRSYGLREADDRFGLVCVYQADSAETLYEHAKLVGLPAEEIVPVAATVLVRPDAPARIYLIRRRNYWRTPALLERTAAISRRIGDEEMADKVSWIRSYAVREHDGKLGTFCIYQAVDPAALKEHAERVGMPADEITPVIGRVVYREDPASAPVPRHGATPA